MVSNQGILLQSVHNIGTVKEFVYYGMSEKEKNVPDFIVVQVPQFWDYTGNKNEWKRIQQVVTIQNYSIEHGSKDVEALTEVEPLPVCGIWPGNTG